MCERERERARERERVRVRVCACELMCNSMRVIIRVLRKYHCWCAKAGGQCNTHDVCVIQVIILLIVCVLAVYNIRYITCYQV